MFATFGLVALPSHLIPLDQAAPAVVLLIGLAVGVDYSMFYLRREREERAAGRSEQAALEAAAATSGRSVLISGLTVMVAMAGMFLTGDAAFASFGYATIIVVAVAMLGSLTVLPALLSKLGDRVDRLRVPLVGRRRGRGGGEGRFWGAIVDAVLRRPVLSAVLSGGLLVALALPAIHLRIATPGADTFPKSLAVVKTYDRMQQAFPGSALPAHRRRQGARRERACRPRRDRRAEGAGRSRAAGSTSRSPSRPTVTATVAKITLPTEGNGTDAASKASLAVLRDDIIPQTVGASPQPRSA